MRSAIKIVSSAEKLFDERPNSRHIPLDTFRTLWSAVSTSSIRKDFSLVAGLSQKELEEIETCMSKTVQRLFGIIVNL